MGYSLKIGEAVLDYSADRVHVTCQSVSRDDAPAYGEPTDHMNTRWPSYSGWANSMESLGLMDVMFNLRNGGKGDFEWNGVTRSPLIETHPGSTPVTKEHLEFVKSKLAEYKSRFPDHIAKFRPPKPGAKPIFGNEYREEDYDSNPIYDANLCRAEWLIYWLQWAIDNCKQPVFVNS